MVARTKKSICPSKGSPNEKITDQFKVSKKSSPKATPKRKTNRFNGISEEELSKRGLADIIKPDLDILFIGINPGMYAAYTGHYYSSPANHFWQALYLSGFLPQPMSSDDDTKMLDYGMGFTDICPR